MQNIDQHQREAFFLFNVWSERMAALALQAPLVFDSVCLTTPSGSSPSPRRTAAWRFFKNVEMIPRWSRPLVH